MAVTEDLPQNNNAVYLISKHYDTRDLTCLILCADMNSFFVNHPVLFLLSPVISVERLKDVTTSGIQKKVSSEDLRFDTRIKGLLKDYLVLRMIMICRVLCTALDKQ